MKHIVILIGICALIFCRHAAATVEAPRSLMAELVAEHTVIPELESGQLNLQLSLLNNTGKDVMPADLTPALCVGQEKIDLAGSIKDDQAREERGQVSLAQKVAIGAKWEFSYVLTRQFKPGTYNLHWEGIGFKSPEVTVRILEDQIPIDSSEPQPYALTRAIRAVLPKDWVAYAETDYPTNPITICRTEPTLMAEPFVTNGGIWPDSIRNYSILLTIPPFISPEKHARFKAENVTIKKQLAQMSVGMRRRLSPPPHEFFTETSEEKAQVEKYRNLEKSIHYLPHAWFHGISVNWFTREPTDNVATDYFLIRDKAIRAQCREVTEKIVDLLNWYEDKPAMRGNEDIE